MSDPFYMLPRWRRLRDSVLRRDGYMCREALRYGKHVPATHVHHIFPREQYPEYQWEPWNLIAVSLEAHNAMHDRTTGQLTAVGQGWLERTARKRGIDTRPGHP